MDKSYLSAKINQSVELMQARSRGIRLAGKGENMADETQQPTKTPITELAQKAREHYTELTRYPNDFNSVIPAAIDIWEQHELECERQEQAEKQWQHYEQSRSPETG